MSEVSTPAPTPKLSEINIKTHNLTEIRLIIMSMIDGLNEGPKSRERAIVVTKLEEAFLWADRALMKE
jgi:hypothetical protein